MEKDTQEEASKSPPPSTSSSFLDRINELLTRDKQPAPTASSMATPATSSSTNDALSAPSTPPKSGALPTKATTASHETSPTAQPPPSEKPVIVPASALAAKPEMSSTHESSTSPPQASVKSPAAPISSSASSSTSESASVPEAGPSKVLPTVSSSKISPFMGTSPSGSYPYGPSVFATGTSNQSTPTTQNHTFGQPSVIAPTSLGAAAIPRPPVFGPPSGFKFTIPDPETQGSTTWSSSSGAAPAAASTPPAGIRFAHFASTALRNPSPRLPSQTSPAPPAEINFAATPLRNSPPRLPSRSSPAVPAGTNFASSQIALGLPSTVSPAPGSAASQSATSGNDTLVVVPSTSASSAPWPNLGTSTGSAAPRIIKITDNAASKLVKELEAQIQPLKQKSLLEGLLSHLNLPNMDSLKDDTRCHICLEPFLTGSIPELPIKLPCGHICGSVCILKWLAPKSVSPREKNCPICRKSIYGIESASEWNALITLEKHMLGMSSKLQAMIPSPGRTQNNLPNDAPANIPPTEADIPTAWGRGRSIQAESPHDELQWRAWTQFLEDLVSYVESADEWVRWYHRRRLVLPIINLLTVLDFIEMKKKGFVWISRVIGEVPELYLPLHPFLNRTHPEYYQATPSEEHYRKTADFHARIEGKGRRLWSSHTSVDPSMAQQFTVPSSLISIR